ncbi:dihydrofolate reductase family protein [Nocardia sp. NPDC127579]|uniref:dihydrofolate reductase family protein n=1 Tax=Nocardia sp. NPDC127579 TaxID=3345402 RepID=UPI003630DBE8
MRKLIYYIAVSIDGYIAGPNGEFDFYPHDGEQMADLNADYPEFVPSHLRHHVGMAVDEPNRHCDTVVSGRGTWDAALSEGVTSPYAHMRQYVLSSTLRLDDPNVELVAGDPVGLVRRLKQQDGLDIYLCGGGNLAAQLVGEIDEMIVKSYPVLAGGGISMCTDGFAPTLFTPARRKEYGSGTLVTWFTRA